MSSKDKRHVTYFNVGAYFKVRKLNNFSLNMCSYEEWPLQLGLHCKV